MQFQLPPLALRLTKSTGLTPVAWPCGVKAKFVPFSESCAQFLSTVKDWTVTVSPSGSVVFILPVLVVGCFTTAEPFML